MHFEINLVWITEIGYMQVRINCVINLSNYIVALSFELILTLKLNKNFYNSDIWTALKVWKV